MTHRKMGRYVFLCMGCGHIGRSGRFKPKRVDCSCCSTFKIQENPNGSLRVSCLCPYCKDRVYKFVKYSHKGYYKSHRGGGSRRRSRSRRSRRRSSTRRSRR